MKNIVLVSAAVLLQSSPGRACMSDDEVTLLQSNRAVAIANHCENAIVQPTSIGGIWINQRAEDAVKARAEGIAFEIDGGVVVRVSHTAPVACVLERPLTPLRVITTTSAFAPVAGIAIARDARGVHVTVQRAS